MNWPNEDFSFHYQLKLLTSKRSWDKLRDSLFERFGYRLEVYFVWGKKASVPLLNMRGLDGIMVRFFRFFAFRSNLLSNVLFVDALGTLLLYGNNNVVLIKSCMSVSG